MRSALNDQLIEGFCELLEDARIVVDNGASCFVALCGYLKENGALPFFNGKRPRNIQPHPGDRRLAMTWRKIH